MGDDQRRSPDHKPGKTLLDHLFRSRIDTGRRFVQDQDFRVKGNCPGKRDKLFFANGEVVSPFPDTFIVSCGQAFNEAVGADNCRCFPHAQAGLFITQADVEFYTSVKQAGVLQHDADAPAQVCR